MVMPMCLKCFFFLAYSCMLNKDTKNQFIRIHCLECNSLVSIWSSGTGYQEVVF